MAKRPTTDPAMLAEIARLATLGYSGADIHRKLKADYGEFNAPGLRTIQEHVRRLRPLDTSGTWSLAAADPETAELVLDTLAVMIEATDGRIHSLSNAEAQWVATIQQARPDVLPWTAYVLARAATRWESRGLSLDVLTIFLALAPWRGNDDVWRCFFSLVGKDEGQDFLQEGLGGEFFGVGLTSNTGDRGGKAQS